MMSGSTAPDPNRRATAASIRERIDVLRSLRPDLASFYVLTPFPGTEHYDELLAAGLISERNLDRFDATCPTWRHPHLSDAELSALLARSYREFYALPDAVAKSVRWAWRKRRSSNVLLKIAVAAYSALSRYAVARGMHPMAGGVGRVALDGAGDYAALRRQAYGIDFAPLPRSLVLAEPGARVAVGR
jgi:radical SAM superfamily enzyme YgiQ (UPF0313 family)